MAVTRGYIRKRSPEYVKLEKELKHIYQNSPDCDTWSVALIERVDELRAVLRDIEWYYSTL